MRIPICESVFGRLVVFASVAAMLLPFAAPTAAIASPRPHTQGGPPRLLVLDAASLAAVKAAVQAGGPSFDVPMARLLRDANGAMNTAPLSVVDKEMTPPSGDKRDYVTQAPYYWPNPSTTSGMPYVHRDGERNPDVDRIPDARNLDRLANASSTLALAYYFTGDERYAERTALLLRAWFLDPQTRMNPHLKFAQFVPGQREGSPHGIIEIHSNLSLIIDAVGLLAGSSAWTEADQAGMQDWMGGLLTWLLRSDFGAQEGRAKNNHSTFYDAQVVNLALFVGRDDLAVKVLEETKVKRIASQIEPDGRQPEELRRTRSWHYSVFNLRAFFRLATLGDRVGVDLWNYQTEDGCGIRRALDYLVPFAVGEQEWAYQQIDPLRTNDMYALLRQAALRYHSEAYWRAVQRMAPADAAAHRLNLTLPVVGSAQ